MNIMTENQAREILGNIIHPDNHLHNLGAPFYVYWQPGEDVTLDGTFTLDQLEAIVWWVREKGGVKCPT